MACLPVIMSCLRNFFVLTCLFCLYLFRLAYFSKEILRCPICGKPCPSTESNDLAKEQDALVHNLQEVSRAQTFVYMSGRAQATGKRAAASAFKQADFNQRVSADDSLFGNADYRINKVTGVYMFSFWYAIASRFESRSSSITACSLLPCSARAGSL